MRNVFMLPVFKYCAFLIACILIFIDAKAQFASSDYLSNDTYSVAMPSVQEVDQIKYGKTPIDYYTGRVNVSIPLYTYKDHDFEIPISISYTADGYKPNIPTDILGLGWTLDAGGIITREVKGAPDDYNDSYYSYFFDKTYNVKGFYFYKKEQTVVNHSLRLVPKQYMGVKYYDDIEGFPFLNIADSDYYYETLPDVFSFNFMGHSGKFCLDPDADEVKFKVFDTNNPSCEYKISVVEVSDPQNLGLIRSLKIQTGDGYEYVFGNGAELLYHSNSIPYFSNSDYNILTTCALSWLLWKVVAPNGREMVFNYDNSQFLYYDSHPKNQHGALGKYEYDETLGLNYNTQYPQKYYAPNGITENGKSKEVVRTSKSLLQSITTDIATIDFEYNDRKTQESIKYQDRYALVNRGALTGISVNGITRFGNLFQAKFHYLFDGSYFDGEDGDKSRSNVMFLRTVDIQGLGKYELKYFDENSNGLDIGLNLPLHGVVSIDRWGYLSSANEYVYGINASNGYPNLNATRKGMLSKITYPTKGYTTFDYELHDYNKVLVRSNQDATQPLRLEYCDLANAGGLRISNIMDYTEDNNVAFSREFEYSENGSSTGASLNFPYYVSDDSPSSKPGDYSTVVSYVPGLAPPDMPLPELNIIAESNNVNGTLDRTHIEYSFVREKYQDGSYSEYNFSNYGTKPDETVVYNNGVVRNKTYHKPGEIIDINGHYLTLIKDDTLRLYEHKMPSMYLQRGKLLRKVDYSSNHDTVKIKELVYDYDHVLSFVEGLETTPNRYYKHKMYTDTYPVKSIKNIEFLDGKKIENQEDLYYNSLGQLSRQETFDSNGDTISQTILYPTDGSTYNPILMELVRKNMIGIPVEVTNAKNGDIISGRKITFRSFYSNKYFPEIYSEWNVNSESYDTQSTINRYDLDGNIIQITSKDGVPTTYLWGYAGQYPIAEFKNATYQEVESVLTSGFISKLLNEPRPHPYDIAYLDACRADFPGVQITTYTYEPLVGVVSMTDPSGRTVYYGYDDMGRLERVLDDKRNVIEQYEYSYRTN